MYSLKNNLIDIIKYTQLQEQLGSLLYSCNEIQIDSRKVSENDIFCAYPGGSVDGRSFIEQVSKLNPCAIIYEDNYTGNIRCFNLSANNLQQFVGMLAAEKYNYPSQQMVTIGVTGTNGKTSISHWVNQAFSNLGLKTGIVGTTGCGIYPNVQDLSSTTPDPVTLQKLFLNFSNQNVNLVAIEVSSHALHQGRVNGVVFDTAIFTNLTQDHLDYHGTLEEYYKAKEQLFYWQNLKNAIINVDDEYGEHLFNNLAKSNLNNTKLLSYGIEKNSDLQAKNIQQTLQGLSFELHYKQQKLNIKTKVIGLFNVYNLLAVFASLIAQNVELNQIEIIASKLEPVVGRMEAHIQVDKPLVVVDYAHTPDALEKALQTLNSINHDKLYCVFGCGGNRDKSKRKIMGQVSRDLADYSYITSDNPRNEDPLSIINEICTAFTTERSFEIVEERKNAILKALKNAGANDIVLIAGKGHETYQEIHGIKHHFSDVEVVKECFGLNDSI